MHAFRWLPRGAAAAGLAVAAALLLAPPASAVGPGDPVPPLAGPRLGGPGELSLESLRGRVVYVDFWASWCPPCLSALPELEALRRDLGGRGFAVVGVNLDREPARATRLVERFGLGYPSISDPSGALPERFDLRTMPTGYLIDRKGVVRHVHAGFRSGDGEKLRREIRALLEAR